MVESATLPLRSVSRSNINRNMVGRFGERAGHLFFLDQVGKHRHVRRPLSCDPSIFSEVSPDRVNELRSLPHQQVTGPKHQTRRLLLFALHGHEPHARPGRPRRSRDKRRPRA
ncbi:UNVERIFIED_ORG: hypothetical protein M2187_008364 [Bradyrhizobium japonicum]